MTPIKRGTARRLGLVITDWPKPVTVDSLGAALGVTVERYLAGAEKMGAILRDVARTVRREP